MSPERSKHRVPTGLDPFGALSHPRNSHLLSLCAGRQEACRALIGRHSRRIYFLSLPGFDTHSLQWTGHLVLLRQMSESFHAFFEDLAAHSAADRTLLFSYADFGRPLRENGSRVFSHMEPVSNTLVNP